MEVIIKSQSQSHITFEDLDFGTIFLYQQYHCMKIFNNYTNHANGLILDYDNTESMETINIDYDEPIYQTFPNSKLIIE